MYDIFGMLHLAQFVQIWYVEVFFQIENIAIQMCLFRPQKYIQNLNFVKLTYSPSKIRMFDN